MAYTERDRLLQRKQALWNERSSYVTHWREISDHMMPRTGRFFETDRNNGKKKHNNIINSKATRSVNVLASGMMAGMTSPARPWFRLATPDTDLMEYAPVREWLDQTGKIMRQIFAQSNTYNALHQMYKELGLYGTAFSFISPDFDDVLRHYPLTIGEYALAIDARQTVKTMYREVPMTIGQVVKQFGKEKCSPAVINKFDKGLLDSWITVIHVIEPRYDRDTTKKDGKNKAFKSCYFEAAANPDKLLSESGYDEFPGLAPRWDVLQGDVYGSSPGMEALGDVKALQHKELRKAQAIDYQTKPPLQMPIALKNQEVNSLPGGVAYVDTTTQQGGIRPQFEVNLNLQSLMDDIERTERRVDQAFYADLFLMLANDTRSGVTATEVVERHEEKLLMVGPVLERLHNEMLNPMIDVTFSMMVKAGILPQPPKEMEGQSLQVDFVSTLAQAQQLVGINSLDRYAMTIGTIAQMKPEVLDKFDADQFADVYSQRLGVDSSVVIADDKVAIIRQQRAEEQAQAQQMAMAQQMAETASKAGGVPTQGGESNLAADMVQGAG
tara:strand:- start:6528 stop:8189 length:1662 start_codon:yes stop_codon:yes gene_type:complete